VVLERMVALEAQQGMAQIPVATVDDPAAAAAIIYGTPIRFGNKCGQMCQLLDTRRTLAQRALVGKVSIWPVQPPSTAARN